MVLHSHMLNPRDFLEDCIRAGKMSLWRTGFPLAQVNACIDNATLEYSVSRSREAQFEFHTGVQWDNLKDPASTEVQCPRCDKITTVPWTKLGQGQDVKEALKNSTGLADRSFEAICKQCLFCFNHDRLRVAKFRRDLNDLLTNGRPMPGSILNINGIPEGKSVLSKKKSHLCAQMMFPNQLMQVVGKFLLGFTDGRLDRCESINDLRGKLEEMLGDRHHIDAAHALSSEKYKLGSRIRPAERVHFRRMMSHYWENFSPFALDLVGAVIRQGTFVQKMDNIDWLHSPTVMETAGRLIEKYKIFLQIMHQNPTKMAVPTLDVDLAWHTHQLQPRRYYTYTTRERPGYQPVFVNHDDKVAEDQLNESFEWTSKMYQRATGGGIYSECTCWYCEATRAPDLRQRIFHMDYTSRARHNADSLHDREDISSDPEKNPHISAHNAVRPIDSDATIAQLRAKKINILRLRRNYETVARRAEKRGRARPDAKRTANGGYEPCYYFPYAWGYPVMLPYYAPYMSDPGISSDSYACNPSCMSVGVGMSGNCCTGTCGGGVAAGACGGLGSAGGCGSLGGCGGGGGGGGGGGCGGGGCGGGGGGGGCGGGS